jgi:hypothetical protein
MTVAPSIGELPKQQRAEIIRQLMIKMAQRADIGCEINEDENGILIWVPKQVR